MVRVNKNISKLFILGLLILTFIQLSDSRGGRGGLGGRGGFGSRGRSRGHGSSRRSKGLGEWFSSLFSSSKKTSGGTKPIASNVHSNKPIGWNVDSSKPVGWKAFPGGVKPPVEAPAHHNAYPYSAQPLPGHQSVGGYRPPPPPPPPGFLNPPHTGGAPPSYTYSINNYYSRSSSNNNLLASLAIWELMRSRSHYHVYSTTRHNGQTSVNKVPETSTLEPGNVYLVTPNNVNCSIIALKIPNDFFLVECDSGSSINLTVILPNNKTSYITCDTNIFSKCIGRKSFTEDEMIRVKFEVFNATKVYGEPLCNTTVVDGILTVDNATEFNNSTACIYPPYKWTGKNWTTIYEEEKKEKIKQNFHSVYNLTNLENNTLEALSHATLLGKLYNFLTINKN